MSSRLILEVAVTTAEEAVRAVAAGADRLELCSALEVGGVTPSPGTFLRTRERLQSTPISVLVRPRPGGFCYSDDEFDTLFRDADWFMSHGAAGVVSGVLSQDGCIDRDRCSKLFPHAKGRAVFHRAFDFVTDQFAALDQLIELGFERVLTSGGAVTAPSGTARIAELVRRSRGRIVILPGGGITPENVAELIRATSCTQVHGSFRSAIHDPSLNANPELAAPMGRAMTTDAAIVRAVRERLDAVAFGTPDTDND